MKINTLLFLITGSVLAVSHYLSIEFALYWRYLWLDIPVHFIGGVTVVLVLWTLRDLRAPLPRGVFTLWPVIIFTLIIAGVWEIFDWQAGIDVIAGGYLADTALDIIMGLLGGVTGWWIGSQFSNLNNDNE